ncbi:MAG: 4Fe-4S dicluster domain-containing protein [Clostridiales bacterium]|nr:4Fe-4S dicluster domain-containing protein [Clostridiales bacterium]
MKYFLDLDQGKCIACGACAIACMDQNDTEVERGERPFRKVFTIEKGKGPDTMFTYLSISCMHCLNAPCVSACPAGCIKKDLGTGLTVYDNTNCIGCHSCAMACPFAAPQFNAEGRMVKCDGCSTRVQNGLQPACVRTCPFDALKLYTEEEYDREKSRKASLCFINRL